MVAGSPLAYTHGRGSASLPIIGMGAENLVHWATSFTFYSETEA